MPNIYCMLWTVPCAIQASLHFPFTTPVHERKQDCLTSVPPSLFITATDQTVGFSTANLNFLRRPLLVFHTRVCNLLVFGMCCLLYFLFYLFWGKVSCSPGRLFNSIVEDDSLPLPPTELGFQVLLSHHSPLLLCWGLYQGFVHSRWAVFQLSHIPSPRLLFYMLLKILCY